jgi:hypothetical protein
MEKVKIIRCEEKHSKDGTKTFYSVSLEDGRKASGFENLTEFVNQEIELEVVKKGDYWNFKYEKPKKGVAAAHPDYRVVAAECTSRAALSNPEEINKILELYYTWLIQE